MKLKDIKDPTIRVTHPKLEKNKFLKYSAGNSYDSDGFYLYEVYSDHLVCKGLVLLYEMALNSDEWVMFDQTGLILKE